MVKTINIDGEIEKEVFDKLVEFYNDLGDSYARIYLSSHGGATSTGEVIVDLVNENAEKTTLIGYDNLFSCGFSIFFMSKCNKYLLNDCVGMYHQSIVPIDMNEFWKPKATDVAKKKYMTEFMRVSTEQVCFSVGMSDEEIGKIRDGEDVYFYPDRMREFLIYQNKVF